MCLSGLFREWLAIHFDEAVSIHFRAACSVSKLSLFSVLGASNGS
jgi:hypothetical protein